MGALRGYQQEALRRISQGGNHIVVAPTGKCFHVFASIADHQRISKAYAFISMPRKCPKTCMLVP